MCFLMGSCVFVLFGMTRVTDATDELSCSVVTRLASAYQSLNSLYIEFQEVTDLSQQDRINQLHRIVVASNDGRFLRDNSHLYPEKDWRTSSVRKISNIIGGVVSVYSPMNRTVVKKQLQQDDSGMYELSLVGEEFLFDVLGWWPYEQFPEPKWNDNPTSIRRSLTSDRISASRCTEQINGHSAYLVVLNDFDCVYVAEQHPEILLRREIKYARTGALHKRYNYFEHDQLTKNIWIARRFGVETFDSMASNPELCSRLLAHEFYQVNDVRINEEVVDKDFFITFCPGTITYDRDSSGQSTLLVSREDDHLVAITERTLQEYFPTLKATTPATPAMRKFKGFAVCFGFFLVCSGLVIGFVRNRRSIRYEASCS